MARLPSYPAEIGGISRRLIASQERRVSYDDRPSVGVEVVELWRGGKTGKTGRRESAVLLSHAKSWLGRALISASICVR